MVRLEHVPEKWVHFSDKDMLHLIEVARILVDRVIPPDRNARLSAHPRAAGADKAGQCLTGAGRTLKRVYGHHHDRTCAFFAPTSMSNARR